MAVYIHLQETCLLHCLFLYQCLLFFEPFPARFEFALQNIYCIWGNSVSIYLSAKGVCISLLWLWWRGAAQNDVEDAVSRIKRTKHLIDGREVDASIDSSPSAQEGLDFEAFSRLVDERSEQVRLHMSSFLSNIVAWQRDLFPYEALPLKKKVWKERQVFILGQGCYCSDSELQELIQLYSVRPGRSWHFVRFHWLGRNIKGWSTSNCIKILCTDYSSSRATVFTPAGARTHQVFQRLGLRMHWSSQQRNLEIFCRPLWGESQLTPVWFMSWSLKHRILRSKADTCVLMEVKFQICEALLCSESTRAKITHVPQSSLPPFHLQSKFSFEVVRCRAWSFIFPKSPANQCQAGIFFGPFHLSTRI